MRSLRAYSYTAALSFAFVGAMPGLASDYLITDLGALGPGRGSVASGINKEGKVVGQSDANDGLIHWVIWNPVNGIQDLGVIGSGGVFCAACSINSDNQIAGSVGDSQVRHATVFDNGVTHLFGANGSYALSINEQGQAVGATPVAGNGSAPFIWDAQRGLRLISLPQGASDAAAWKVNNLGQVVGQMTFSNSTPPVERPFLWDAINGAADFLGTSPPIPGYLGSAAVAINDSGQIALFVSTSGSENAYLWDPRTGLRRLDVLPFGRSARPWAINASGQVVGSADTLDGSRAVTWDANGDIHDLGVLPGATASQSTAYGINDAGQIVGVSSVPNGIQHAVLWQPFLARLAAPSSVECSSPAGATVHLDASASRGNLLTFTFNGPFGSVANGTNPVLDVNLPLGLSQVSVTVVDSVGHSLTAGAAVNVRDTLPPIVSASLLPLTESEDSRRYSIVFSAKDICDPAPSISGDLGSPVANGEVAVIEVDTKLGLLKLPVANFRLVVRARDASGNIGEAVATP